ncbi:hypothetical protein ITX34_00520 [Streptomyces bryophytorum]|nr:hypothetical protein [Actinacidiphila bryophytorum]
MNFRDHKFAGHGRRWVDVKYFRIAPESLDDELLALLVADEQFRDDYAGGGTDPAGQRHGPYWHCHITMDAYSEVGSAAAVRTVRHWAGQHGALPEALERVMIEQVYAVLASATRCFVLSDLGAPAFHDWGGVHTEFHEYVAIDRERLSLMLIVAADD